jgi:gliding motility-associated-like protein
MRGRILLVAFITFFLFSGRFEAQSNQLNFTKVFSSDSLVGFDEPQMALMLTAEGYFGNDFKHAMETQKRAYIINKFELNKESETTGTFEAIDKKLGGSGIANAAPCVNEDFEAGSINGWTASIGSSATGSTVYPTFTNNISAGSLVTVVATPYTDPFVGTIPPSPLGGGLVSKINNTVTGTYQVIRLAQNFLVTSTNYLFDFAYWAVMENAGGHNCVQTPYMLVKLRVNGNLQSCPNFSIVAPSSGAGGCAGIGPTTWNSTVVAIGTNTYSLRVNNAWQKFSIDLAPHMGSNVTIEAVVAHCSLGGHFGYAYFDSQCNTMNLTVNNTQTLSMQNGTVYPSVLCGSTATLTAPAALVPRTWTGPAGSGVTGTAQTVTTSVAGNYTLSFSPPGMCNTPVSKIIALSFAPPTTLAASPATICTGVASSSTLTASGATSYTWLNTSQTGSSIVVSPTITTIYTVAAVTGTCNGTSTIQVNVAPNPTVAISNPQGSVCAGQSATLTASGASSYVWNPGGMTGSMVVVAPTSSVTYTAVGTSTDGCTGTATTTIFMGTPPSIQAFNLTNPTGSVCAGTTVLMIASGASGSNYTWVPTSPLVTGNIVNLTPSVTTTYTVIGATGTCTNSTVVTVLIDPGPSQTVTGTPTITCPGNSATLTSVAPTATGFTWTPGSSNTSVSVIAPTVTTVYSVQAINSNNCRSTFTINHLVAPVPTIVISPPTPSVCIGSTITLTATGGTSYTWSPGGMLTGAVAVSPTNNTVYTVTASNGTCTSTQQTTLTVVPLPTVSASGTSTICATQIASLSAIGASTYTWMPGSLAGANVTVSPAATTVYTVTGNLAGCTASAMKTVTVYPNPTISVVATPTAVCPGFCSTLVPSGASTYTYVGFVPPSVCPTITTTYSVSGTSSMGCVALQPGTVTVLVNPVPSISITASSLSVCLGSAATLTPTGATAYTWMPGGLTTAIISVTPAVTTVYTVTGVNATGCISTRTVSITVVPIPTVSASGTSTICAGQVASLSAIGATSYTWRPGVLTTANVTVSPSATTVYTVTGSTAGCTATAMKTVTVYPNPTISIAANPTAVCPGVCSTLTPSGASTYTFIGATSPVCPTITTTYSVSGTSSMGCVALQPGTVTVIVNPVPSITITASSLSVCLGSAATLTPTGATSYTWMPGGLTTAIISVTPAVTTVYTVTGVNATGCVSTRTVSITVVPIPAVSASGTSTICAGQIASLSAIGATNYTWMPGVLTTANVTVSPSATTIYTVTGSTSGCTATAMKTVTVYPNPTISVVANPTAICPGLCSTLTPSGASTYTFIGATSPVCPTITTTYSVSGTSSLGCVSAQPGTVTVIVNPVPSITLTPSAATICAGGSVSVTATGANNYTWNPGNLTGGTQALSPTVTTIYTVTGLSASGCSSTKTIAITVVPTPTITASASSPTICLGNSTTLTANGATSYTWLPGSMNGSTVSVTPTITTTYTVTGSTSGCPGLPAIVTVSVFAPVAGTAAVNPTGVCAGGCTTLSLSGYSGTIQWQSSTLSSVGPFGNIAGATNSLYTYCPVNSTTWFRASVSSICGSAFSGIAQVTLNPSPSLTLTPSAATICAGGSASVVATGATNYTWNPGNLPGASQVLSPGVTTTYTVTGTNSSGCAGTNTITITVVPIPVVGASASPATVCAGAAAVLTGTGATTYSWNPGNLSGAAVSVTPAVTTIYTVTGTTSGCSGTRTVMVTVNPRPTITVTANQVSVCPGFCSTLTPSGALTYTYLNGGPVVCPTITTSYSVSGTNSLGCVSLLPGTTNVTVNAVPSISIAASAPSICAGSAVTMTATGATAFTWMPGNLNTQAVTVTPTITTVYTVTGSNSSGCVSTRTISIIVVPNPTVTASANPSVACAGAPIVLTGGGASTYTWQPGSLSGGVVTVTLGTSSTFTVFGTLNGCTGAAAVNITVNPLPSIVATASPATVCPGKSTTLSATGASTYTWNPGNIVGNNISVTPTANTTYTVAGTSAAGCISTTVVNVFTSPSPTVTASSPSLVICSGTSVVLTGGGAVGYTWQPGGLQTQTIQVSPNVSTTYSVTGASAAGCTAQAFITITVIATPTILVSANPATICAGGSSTLSATGASNYTWLPGSMFGTTVVVSPTVSTTYSATSNNGGCVGTSAAVLVTVNNGPSISATASPTAICPGGVATLTGTGAVSYTWQPMGIIAPSTTVAPLATTVYTLRGATAFGCTTAINLTLVVNPVPSVSVSPAAFTICPGGFVILTASGASGYTWMPGSVAGSTLLASPTISTIYTVTGANTFSCTNQRTVNIFVAPVPVLTLTSSSPTVCPGGSATLTGAGATSYTWSTGPNGSTIVVNPTITTTYTLTGSNGICTTVTAITITVSPVPTLTAIASPTAICPGNPASLMATGANSYTWQPGSLPGGTVTVNPLITTLYTVTGTNGFGCTGSRTLNLLVNPKPTIVALATPTVVCAGGTVALTATGGIGYTWTPGNLTGSLVVITPTATTVYTVTGISSAGCTNTAAVTVSVNSRPIVTASASPVTICAGSSSTLSAGGALFYAWSNSAIGAVTIVSPTITTTYTVTGTGANGCSNTATVTVNVNPTPTITASASPTAICVGNQAVLSPSGATTYTWLPGPLTGPNVTVSPSSSQVYTVTGTTAGCTGSVTLSLVVNPNPTVTASASPTLSCPGLSVTLTGNGATSYTWMPGGLAGTNVTVTPFANTTYTVTGATGNCTSTAMVSVSVAPAPTVVAATSATAICAGSGATLTATGAGSYTWQPGGLNGNTVAVTPPSTTIYTVTGSNGGCSGSTTIAVNVINIPTVSATANPNPMCSGTSATLTGAGATSYSWMPGSLIGSTVSVSPSSTTNYTLSGSSGPGCTGTTVITLTVNPTPTVLASSLNSSVCVGYTTALSASGANAYTWSPGAQTGSFIVETITATTVYTVTGESNGCSSTATISIIAVPLPTIVAVANPSILCIGDQTTLTATGALTYTWLPSLATGAAITDTPAASMVYTVVGFANTGCPNFATVAVNVLPQPTVTAVSNPTVVCLGSTATLTANGATTYSWQPGALNGSTVAVSPTGLTVYTVTGQTGSCVHTITLSLGINPLPTITAVQVNTTILCAGSTISLTASGALNYTWMPSSLTGSAVVDTPTSTTDYTVTGEDANGCQNIANVTVTVMPLPVITPVATPTGICQGASVTVTVSGASTYTWAPVVSNATLITDSPSVTSTYSVNGTDSNGCIGTGTVTVSVFQNPTVAVIPNNATVCAGSPATLTASGATNYTWLPGSATGSVIVFNPTVTTNYTVTGDNGGVCFNSFTVDIIVNPLPAGVTATCSGTITCASPVVTLSGSSSNTGVSFSWNGPSGFTSTNPTPTVSAWGTYTLMVTNTVTGCSASQTVNVPTDNSIPSITATASGSITCSAVTVSLNAAVTTASAGYSWSGPSAFSSTSSAVSVSLAGTYTVIVIDLNSNCSDTALVTVGVHTQVAITSSISAPTCSAGISNNDGSIYALGFGSLDKYDIVAGATYTGTADYTTAIVIPGNGVLTNNLANPTGTMAFTVRFFDSEGCFKDTTLVLLPVDCTPRVFGIAKAVSQQSLNTDGTYNVQYKVVVTNTDTSPLTGISLNEDLTKTFLTPVTFTVLGPPVVNGGNLTVNSSFDGALQKNLLNPVSSTLNASSSDTVLFTVRVKPNGVFGPFLNTITGIASTRNNIIVSDSSNTGLNADPDTDLNPMNNNIPTSLTLTPNFFFGLTKVGSYVKLDNETYNVHYAISVHNLGNDTLRNISVKDTIFNRAIKLPASYTVIGTPVTDGQLVANALFNGRSDAELLIPGQSKIAPGTVSHISFTINVNPDSVRVLVNSASGEANGGQFKDISNDGDNPDTNNNGVWNEPSDNRPTILVLPPSAANTPTAGVSLFIPGGFSPNNDGINDLFEIRGLPTNGDNSITIFNRWGNRVYYHGNYNNTWNGHPNIAGTLGKDKLPQGTYFFILEMKGDNVQKTGFIVIEY